MITGLGTVTPVGIGADVAYKAMCEGKSGIVKLPSWADEYPAQVRQNFINFIRLQLPQSFLFIVCGNS